MEPKISRAERKMRRIGKYNALKDETLKLIMNRLDKNDDIITALLHADIFLTQYMKKFPQMAENARRVGKLIDSIVRQATEE
jgi:hypothetical protein